MDRYATRYFVNDEAQETTKPKLTVLEILKNAGLTPVEDYDLNKRGNEKPFAGLDVEVPIEKNDHFVAVFKGTTPLSGRSDLS